MSTPSLIAIKTEKGYKAVYCHFDGMIERMFPKLRKFYGTEELATKLVSLGGISHLEEKIEPSTTSHSFDNPEPDVTVFYTRDREEPWEWNCPVTYSTKRALLKKQYYIYIFEKGHWRAYANGVEKFMED